MGTGSGATETFYLDLVVKFTCKTRVFRLKSQVGALSPTASKTGH